MEESRRDCLGARAREFCFMDGVLGYELVHLS